MDEIVNKVANSVLEVFDLEDCYPSGIRTQLDISQWLLDGFLLKEKDFREALKNHDWSKFQNHFVAIHCSSDAIIPAWASILVTVYLYQEILSTLDYSKYQDKPIILKGCSKKPVPESAYIMAIQKLQPFAKSIMYGEACSAVPLYKKSK